MPDLGKYAFEVLSAYGASLGILAVLIVVSLRRGARVLAELRKVEQRKVRADG